MRNGNRTRVCRRRGFSLLEMTAVIGIIMLLMAMAVIGFRYVEAKGSKDRTRTYLHNAEGLLADLDRTGTLSRLEGTSGQAAFVSGQKFPDSLTDVSLTGPDRAKAITDAQLAMNILTQTPANKQSLNGWPVKGLVNSGTGVALTTPVIADGWGNPIIYVPSGGLPGVNLGKKPDGSFSQNGLTITAPDGRGFWASAGPDGDFSSGDDNIYSFEK